MNDYYFWGIWATCALIMLIYYARKKFALRYILFGMLTGGAALVLLHFYGGNIGFAPELNLFNAALSTVLGLPGVLLMYFCTFV